MDAKIEGPDTTGADPRRHRPMTITWDGMIGRLWIDDEFWGAVDVERLGSRGVYRERCSNCLNNPAAKVS